jgi:hypothetical protein
MMNEMQEKLCLDVSEMSTPRRAKYKKYEKYALEHGRLAHPIVIDERGVVRAGYISYLLAEQYGFDAEIYTIPSSEMIEKHVLGRHVVWDTCKKKYSPTLVQNYMNGTTLSNLQWFRETFYASRQPEAKKSLLLKNPSMFRQRNQRKERQ